MKTARNKRGVFLFAIGVGLLFDVTLLAQNTNSPLETFQRFTTGRIPIKDAVAHFKVTQLDGVLISEDWFRFGYQSNSMYVTRLTPDTNNVSMLIQGYGHEAIGVSFDQLWTVSDRNLHAADKEFSTGSVPDYHGAYPRSLVTRILGMGIAGLENTNLLWSGTNFSSKMIYRKDLGFDRDEAITFKGHLIVDSSGIPRGAEYSYIERTNTVRATVKYEYESSQKEIPFAFTIKLEGAEFGFLRYEFLSLTLATEKLEDTGGYVPTMFGDPKLRRKAVLWFGTNYQSVDELDVRLPAITTQRTNPLSFTFPKRSNNSRR